MIWATSEQRLEVAAGPSSERVIFTTAPLYVADNTGLTLVEVPQEPVFVIVSTR